jgi:hypothetical protein
MRMAISNTRRSVAGVLLAFGIFFTVLALAAFAMPFIATLTLTYEGGAQAWGAFLFYVLLAVPACICTPAAVLVRGWRAARVGYITLACLFGIPLLTFIAALIHAGYDSARHKFAV